MRTRRARRSRPTMLRGRIRLGSAGRRGALGDRAPLHRRLSARRPATQGRSDTPPPCKVEATSRSFCPGSTHSHTFESVRVDLPRLHRREVQPASSRLGEQASRLFFARTGWKPVPPAGIRAPSFGNVKPGNAGLRTRRVEKGNRGQARLFVRVLRVIFSMVELSSSFVALSRDLSCRRGD
jgi:hypothetical protein